MLSKEVKDILEGIHFFLVEGLKSEALSGKAECLRRGLLLQLEGLRTTYPFLHFTSSDRRTPSASAALNVRSSSPSSPPPVSDFGAESHTVSSSRLSTSSGSTNYSSTGASSATSNGSSAGYSGDGGGCKDGGQDSSDILGQNYEDFEESSKCSDRTTASRSTRRRNSSRRSTSSDSPLKGESVEDKEEDEAAYSEDVDPVPFRILVSKCDYHGVLSKRSKGLLPGMRNVKTFLCVLSGSLLFLYSKESDDHQKKAIDLNGYRLHELPTDETTIKFPSRRKDFAFQLCGPGKKPHTFFTTNRIAMERWARVLTEAIANYSLDEATDEVPPLRKSSFRVGDGLPLRSGEEDFEEDDGQELNESEEVYEELNHEQQDPSSSSSSSLPSLWKPPATTTSYQTPTIQSFSRHPDEESIAEYYSVPEAGEQIQPWKHIYYNQMKRVPPVRPPLPTILREALHQQQQTRPLPKAPGNTESEYEKSYDDEIYCEIEEEILENNFQQNSILMKESSLSKEIFDTINKRVPELPQRTIFHGGQRDVENNVELLESENYDVPSDSSLVFDTKQRDGRRGSGNLPYLPPKRRESSTEAEEESEYKVPNTNTPPEIIYDVPRKIPLPVEGNSKEFQHSGRYENFLENSQSRKLVGNSLSDRLNGESESERLNEDKNGDEFPEPGTENSAPTMTMTDSKLQTKADEVVLVNSPNSVKDMIAKLNKTDNSLQSSQKQFGNSSVRKSKIRTSCSENQFLVENVSKFEISRSVQSIKNDLESKEKPKPKISGGCKENCLDIVPESVKEHSQTSQNGVCSTSADLDFERNDQNLEKDPQNSAGVESTTTATTATPTLFVAKFAFVPTDGTIANRGVTLPVLSFSRGDEILVTEARPEERLWKGVVRGREGLVPREYLRRKDTPP